MGFPVSDQVDLMLPLLGLQTVLGASVMANTTAAENDDDGPHQPKPPEFIVVVATLGLSTTVARFTYVTLIVDTHAGFLVLSETQEERHSAGSSSAPAHGNAGI